MQSAEPLVESKQVGRSSFAILQRIWLQPVHENVCMSALKLSLSVEDSDVVLYELINTQSKRFTYDIVIVYDFAALVLTVSQNS